MLADREGVAPLIDHEEQPQLPHLYAVEATETLQNPEDSQHRRLHTVETTPYELDTVTEPNLEQQLAALAEQICDLAVVSMRLKATTNRDVYNPFTGYGEFKYQLVGDVRPLKRRNVHYPPGVERMTENGRRVFGVDCTTRIDPETGMVLMVRKDHIPPPEDPTTWFVVRGDLKTGVFDECKVVTANVQVSEEGDVLTLLVAPAPSPLNANRGYTTVTMLLSPTYQAVGDIEVTRADYTGRGVGPDPHRISEGNFITGFSTLHAALVNELKERGLDPALLDLTPEPNVVLGRYALAS